MLSFVAIEGKSGIWANRDKALEYYDKGYKVYKDNAGWDELTREDLERIVECDSTGDVSEIKSYSAGGK